MAEARLWRERHSSSRKVNVPYVNILAEEHGGALLEALGVLRCVIESGGMAGTLGIYVGVTVQVVYQRSCYVIALCHHFDAFGDGLLQRIH